MFNLEQKPFPTVSVLARHAEGMLASQHLSELELKEIQHRDTFSLTVFPPDKPLFWYFQCFINVSFSVPGKHLCEAHLPPDGWQASWQGESSWHPASATSFVIMVPVLPPQFLLSHFLWPLALYKFIKEGICLHSSCNSLYFWCLFLRLGYLFYVEGRA